MDEHGYGQGKGLRIRDVLSSVSSALVGVEEDMRSLHEAYCETVCTLSRRTTMSLPDHTSRCMAMSERWGFPPSDIKTSDEAFDRRLAMVEYELRGLHERDKR
jgi:hypothetical protein